MKNKKIIIVGGNAAGPSAAAKAKRVDPSAEVLMFEASEYISTGTCELPYVLSGLIKNPDEIVFYNAEKFKEEKGVSVHTNVFVESIDRKNKLINVSYKNGNKKEFNYDKLVLCTGARSKKIPVFEQNYDNLFTVKTVADVKKILSFLNGSTIKNVVIIGAGYIGLESAEAFQSLGFNVTLVEKNPLPMDGSEIEIQNLILESIQQNSINYIGSINKLTPLITNNKVKSLNIDGRIIDTDLLISAIGFEPNNFLALSSGINIGEYGGIKVDSKLKTSDASIFAAGDNIEVINKVTNKPMYLPLATLAHEYGHIAGANAAGAHISVSPIVRNIAVKIFDNVYSSVGLTSLGAYKEKINFNEVSAVVPNLVKVIPASRKVFGKIIYDKFSSKILGASFFGGAEVTGYADLISALISQNANAVVLSEINYNYTPPNSPFINLLSVLGRKIKRN
jgi:NADPH-dependent 2,4-dienoyl-CoA reductase/sulfur reductase-like enzyme